MVKEVVKKRRVNNVELRFDYFGNLLCGHLGRAYPTVCPAMTTVARFREILPECPSRRYAEDSKVADL